MATVYRNEVARANLPNGGFSSPNHKQRWGMELLRDFVSHQHGDHHRHQVRESLRADLITGTRVYVPVGRKMVAYVLLEPKDNPERVVVIMKVEWESSERAFLDDEDLFDKAPKFHTPFLELLAGLK